MNLMRYILPFVLPFALHAQAVTLSGFVTDSTSGERLIGANIVLVSKDRGTTTNAYGFFSLPGITDTVIRFRVSYVGYRSQEIVVMRGDARENRLVVKLAPQPIYVEEVIVEASRDRRLESPVVGHSRIVITSVKSLPSPVGELDVLKTIQLASGVSPGQEGSNSFYVRGGGSDQNLILLDGIPIYNPNHLFGFFSVFNSDALKSVDFFKGGIPSQYGGRLSSVLSVSMKDGNRERFQISGGLSLLTGRLTLEGPLDEAGRSSYMIAGRRTYLDPVMDLLGDNNGSSVYFYDFNAKLSYSLSAYDWLSTSAYFGRDDLDISDEGLSGETGYNLNWSNHAFSVRWNHLWSSTVFSNLSAAYSSYQSAFASGSISSKPGIRDLIARFDIEMHLSERHFLRGGVDVTRHHVVATSSLLNGEPVEKTSVTSTELQGYLEDDWTLSDRIRIQLGINMGSVTKGRYMEIDPRLNLRYLVDENLSIRASYTAMHQFIHSLSAGAFATPGDTFFPSTDFLRPQRSQQLSIGILASLAPFGLPTTEVSIETYYRSLSNLIMFRQKFSSVREERLRKDVIIGKGWAYGIDLELLRTRGRLNGTMAYSFLVSRRQFDQKNEGRPFAPRFDRTHQVNAAFNYELNDSWKAGATFVLASGTPITVPREVYYLDGQFNQWYEDGVTIEYGDIYAQRLPVYNRLDLSASKSWEGWGGVWEFSVSIYNVYGYRNPLYLTYSGGVFQQYSVGFIPSLGLNFRF